MANNLEEELDICPFIKSCNPDDEEMENYCVLNYDNCEKYLKYKENKEGKQQ